MDYKMKIIVVNSVLLVFSLFITFLVVYKSGISYGYFYVLAIFFLFLNILQVSRAIKLKEKELKNKIPDKE